MGSDGHKESSHRKHRRSSPLSDEDADRSSKKHKHRHHRRHRKKREDETETKHEPDEGGELNDGSPPVPPLPTSSYRNPRPDDDVEEGEILEEDGIDEFKSLNLVHVEEGCVEPDKSSGEMVNGFYSKDDQDQVLNGGLDGNSDTNADREKCRSPLNDKRRRSHQGGKKVEEVSNMSDGKKSHSNSIEDAYKTSCNRYDDDTNFRARSRSRDVGRERSRSRSIMLDEELLAERRDHSERDSMYISERRNADFDLDDLKVTYRSRDWRHGGRESVRDEEREIFASYRYSGREERHESRERKSKDKYVGRNDDIERRRDGERRREGYYKRKDERERSIDRDYRKRNERERSIDWELEWDNRRSRRERSRDRELGRDRRMEKERETSRDRPREREKVRDRNRDRDADRDRRLEEDTLDDRNKNRSMDISSGKSKYENSEYEQDKHRDSKYSRPTETDKRKREDSTKTEVLDSNDDHKREENEQDDFEEAFILKPAEEEEEDLNRIKEKSRRLRQAIMEKYKNRQQQQQEQEAKPQAVDEVKEKEHLENPREVITLPGAVEILGGRTEGGNGDIAEPPISVEKSTPQNVITASERTTGAAGLGEGTPKSERSDDMFCDDIFGDSPAGRRKLDKGGGLPIERSGLHDNWDDAEGYYSYRFGEILDGRYEVIAAHGKGVFSTVVRAKDLKAGPGDPEEVAIKILRNKEAMYKAGVEELGILNKLVGADPEDKRHCVRLHSSFKYRNHLCLVFESLNMNLREVLKKFGRNIGLKLTAVRAYAKQLFIALKHLRNCGVLHCDIKPDNMLVNEAKNVLKLCDFGNAMFAGKNEITPYLVSRFYRAPEIILGLPYDHPMDIWSVGCCLYELYMGKVIFPGPTNNDMLRLHMELKGPFPKKMLRKGAFTDQHFDQDLNFLSTEEDPVTKKTMKRMIVNIRPKDIGLIIKGSAGEDPKMLASFKDLLDKIFVLDPEKRMTVQQALSHPFITGK